MISGQGERWCSSIPPSRLARKCKVYGKLILRKSLKLLPLGKEEEERVEETRGHRGGEGKGGEENFRAFPQFQICHYTTGCHALWLSSHCIFNCVKSAYNIFYMMLCTLSCVGVFQCNGKIGYIRCFRTVIVSVNTIAVQKCASCCMCTEFCI